MKKVSNIAIIIMLTILLFSLIVVSIMYINIKQQYNIESEKYQLLKETVEVLQQEDIQKLIQDVKKVMAGEVLIEDKANPLIRYSYNKNNYPTMDTIEMDLKVIEAHFDDNNGEIIISYFIRYLDKSRRVVRYSSAKDFPSKWMLQKQGEDWIIVEIEEHP